MVRKAADVMREMSDAQINRWFVRVYGHTWQEINARIVEKKGA